MPTAAPRRAYQTLDGLRGVGAFLIVTRHVPAFFGPFRAPESFLAVDLFYLVSGFVVAHAYGERLKRGGFVKDFMKTRLIRLYPLYLIGLAVGVVTAVVSILMDPHSFWTPAKIAESVGTGLLMIPLFPGLAANGSTLNGPTWTLLWELVGNLAYALVVRVLRLWALAVILVVCGIGVIVAELHYGTLDVGYSSTDQWAALARVGFSFFAGAGVYRWVGEAKRTSIAAAWACVAVLGAALAAHPPESMTAAYEIGAVLVGFPLLLTLASRFEPDPLSGRLFSLVGLVSYGVYIVHQPLGNLLVMLLRGRVAIPHGWAGSLVGVVFLAFLVGLSWWLDVYYDAPVRRVLRAWFMPDRRPMASPA